MLGDILVGRDASEEFPLVTPPRLAEDVYRRDEQLFMCRAVVISEVVDVNGDIGVARVRVHSEEPYLLGIQLPG